MLNISVKEIQFLHNACDYPNTNMTRVCKNKQIIVQNLICQNHVKFLIAKKNSVDSQKKNSTI